MRLFGNHTPDPDEQDRVKNIRQAILDCLGGVAESQQQSKIWTQVLYASDIQALWYLRSDLMTLLAGPLGESAARAQISRITDLFEGLLPAAQKSRPNRLGR